MPREDWGVHGRRDERGYVPQDLADLTRGF